MGRTSNRADEAGMDAAHAVPASMRAIVQDRYGDAGVLRLQEVPVPAMADDEVLVRVAAAGLDRGTWHLMAGLPYMVRPVFGLRRPRQAVPGFDLAGTVVALGSAVTRFAVGDEVFGVGTGTFAAYAVASEQKLTSRPDVLPPEQAAVVPISGMTALQALQDVGRLEAGQRVVVVGASGGAWAGSFEQPQAGINKPAATNPV